MIDNERQGVLVLRANVNEVNVEPVDLGHELGEGIQVRLAGAPVVVRHPVVRELLDHGERDALGVIRDGLLLGPVRGRDPSTKFVQRFIRDVDLERAYLDCGLDGAAH